MLDFNGYMEENDTLTKFVDLKGKSTSWTV